MASDARAARSIRSFENMLSAGKEQGNKKTVREKSGPWVSNRKFLFFLILTLVWDGGYHVPGGFTGRVLTGKGTGADFGTRWKPVPEHTRDPHVYPYVYMWV